MKYKRRSRNSRFESLKHNTLKTVVLILILSLFIYSSSYLFSPGVKISIDKGQVIYKNGKLLFSKTYPPSLDPTPAYRITFENVNDYDEQITVKIPYSGELMNVEGCDFSMDEENLYLFLTLQSKELKKVYVLGEVEMEVPVVYSGIYESFEKNFKQYNTSNSTNLSITTTSNNENKKPASPPSSSDDFQTIIQRNIDNLDTYSVILLSLAVVLLVVSSLIIASFSPSKKKKRKIIEPGEILFTEDI